MGDLGARHLWAIRTFCTFYLVIRTLWLSFEGMALCLQCDKWVNQTKGKRAKKFCNDTCRSNYRYAKNKKKTDFVKPYEKAFDAPKLPSNFQDDEPLSFDKLKKKIAPQKGYDDFYRELDEAEELADLERVGLQIEKSALSWRDKQLLKTHGQQIANKKFL
jgi:hypothetical protein